MTGITRFEDLIAWQKARLLAKAVYQVDRRGPFAKDFRLAGQIEDAAVSVMSNIAEGFERDSSNEFHHFLSVVKASCAEVRSKLYVALDIEYLALDEFNSLMVQAEEVGRIVAGLKSSVDRFRKKPKLVGANSELGTRNSEL